MKDTHNNPFITGFMNQSFGTFDNAVPFDVIQPEHFVPAMEWAIAKAQENIAAIKAQAMPTFANTIVALDTAGDDKHIVGHTYHNLYEANSSDALVEINEAMQTLEVNFSNEILFDAELFAKVKYVYDNEYTTLVGEDKRLLEETYEMFTAEGALLSDEQKQRLSAINQEMAVIHPKFSENVRSATNAFQLFVEDRAVLGDMPEMLVQSAAEAAKEKGQEGKYLFTLHAPSHLPFMRYCTDRALRENMAVANVTRTTHGDHDNQDYIKKLVALRHEKAQILGFTTYADFVLSRRMAKNLATVQQFEQKLVDTYYECAKKEVDAIKEFAKDLDGIEELQVWDLAYYEEKYRQAHFSFSDELLRPYFSVDKVMDGMFLHATKLYGITFVQRTDIPVYHEDVKVYEVQDSNQQYVGLFYVDLFPRESKRQGAWMTWFRSQGLYNGVVSRPHISIVCNFTKPTADAPALLTHREVETLFHEFGHSLHGLLSQCTYTSLAGPNVKWDFVELPSQIMENWVSQKESLDLFATHYQTGETIPEEYMQKMLATKNFMIASNGLRQVKLGLLDLMFHSTLDGVIENVLEAEEKVWNPLSFVPHIHGGSVSCTFTHIFSGGYDAGYYSYKWAEVLDADAFAYFQEKGIFNKEVADAFRTCILEKGNSEDPMELYVRFRGKQPDPMALHRREGLM